MPADITAQATVLHRYPSAILIARRFSGKARFCVVYSVMLCDVELSPWCKSAKAAWREAARRLAKERKEN